ncbi:MAG: helix-turn-helix transcriptional regulator [Rhodospirillaceae bacterium]
MPIRITLDKLLADRRMTARDLAQAVGITEANMSLLRTGKVKGIRFSTLEKICGILECQPADLLCFEDINEMK